MIRKTVLAVATFAAIAMLIPAEAFAFKNGGGGAPNIGPGYQPRPGGPGGGCPGSCWHPHPHHHPHHHGKPPPSGGNPGGPGAGPGPSNPGNPGGPGGNPGKGGGKHHGGGGGGFGIGINLGSLFASGNSCWVWSPKYRRNVNVC
jgi:hypothetical protein